MDLNADLDTLHTQTEAQGAAMSQDLRLPSASGEAESGRTISLQLLQFKSHLLEAVEELHIRRDAETCFEHQLSKLILEKQELEWEKESLQHQMELMANQHSESVNSMKKQLQAKIRNLEEEKGKYQVTTELKEKEIANLKEQLKLLQLLKFNLENKSNELEHRLALQSRSKDHHLIQLGKVENRFAALSRQCVTVKQAHERLHQDVDEAMKINKKLTSVNEKKDAFIRALQKELEEVSKQLIKVKMASVHHDKSCSPVHREQQLQYQLNMEVEMNKELRDENAAIQAEKLEVMKSLQQTQQLLLSQTQAVGRMELKLHTQEEQCQVLKQEHEVMQEERKAMEDKVAQLLESHAASRPVWDKERRDCTQGVSTQLFSTSEEGFRGERPLSEPNPSSTLPESGSNFAFAQTQSPDCLEDTMVASGAARGREAPNHPQQRVEHPSHLITSSVSTAASSEGSMLMNNSNLSENDQNMETDQICTTSCLCDDELASKGISSINATSPDHRSADVLAKEKTSRTNQSEENNPTQEHSNREEEQRHEKEQISEEEEEGEDKMEDRRAGERRGRPYSKTTDRGDSQECSRGGTNKSRAEISDKGEGEGRDAEEQREKAETEILAQTTGDKSSDTLAVIDLNRETLLTACKPSGCSRLLQRDTDMDAGYTNKEGELNRVRPRPNPFTPEVQEHQGGDEVKTYRAVPEAVGKNTEDKSVLPSGQAASSQTNGNQSAGIQTELNHDVSSSMTQSEEMDAENKVTHTDGGMMNGSLPEGLDPFEQRSDGQTNMDDTRDLTEDVCADASMDDFELISQVEAGTSGEGLNQPSLTDVQQSVHQRPVSNASVEPASSKGSEQPVAKESLLDDTDEQRPPTHWTHRPSFHWAAADRHTAAVPLSSDQRWISACEHSGPGGFSRRFPSTMSLESAPTRVPLVIARASDLLNASSVSGTAASSGRHQQGEWKAVSEAAAATDKRRVFLSIPSHPVSTSSNTGSSLSGQMGRPVSGQCPESDQEPLQEKEQQQSLFREQISIMEQFLQTERLHLHKRPRKEK